LALLCLSGINDFIKGKKILHILLISILSTIMEWFANKKLHMIAFYNGWNIKWSGLIYLMMYSFSYLYKYNPMLIWIVSFLTMEQFVRIFRVPISKDMFSLPSFKHFLRSTFIDNHQ
ncbi:MAG: hypothetical protein LRY73_04835, partial [Bacillus sp. (in: Bacteria)]|nr:hypothetical protein [Bacillus sp. (in: firmicutes)]